MPLYEDNLESLQRRFPEAHDRILNSSPEVRLEFVPTGSGLPRAKVALEGASTGHALYSQTQDPMGYARQAVAPFNLEEKGTAILIGSGLGYEIAAIWELRPRPERLVIVERFPGMFAIACNLFDLREVIEAPGTAIHLGPIPADLSARVIADRRSLFTDVETIWGASSVLASPEYQALERGIRQRVASLEADATAILRFGPVRLRNFLRNLHNIRRSASSSALKDKFKNVPAIVAGGGPSAATLAPHFKAVRGRALFFAADSIYHVLFQKQNFAAEFLATIDPQPMTYGKLREPVDWTNGSLIYHPAATPDIPTRFARKFVYQPIANLRWDPATALSSLKGPDVFCRWVGEKLTGAPTFAQPMTSVSHLAFYAAAMMGCRPIFLAGQELSFPAGASHAEGTRFQRSAEEVDRMTLLAAPGAQGGEVRTYAPFLEMERIFTYAVQALGLECWNITPGGLRIEGAPYKDAAEALAPFASLRWTDYHSAIRDVFEAEQPKLAARFNVGVVRRLREEMERGREAATAAIREIDPDTRRKNGAARGADAAAASLATRGIAAVDKSLRQSKSLLEEAFVPHALLRERQALLGVPEESESWRRDAVLALGGTVQILRMALVELARAERRFETERGRPTLARPAAQWDCAELCAAFDRLVHDGFFLEALAALDRGALKGPLPAAVRLAAARARAPGGPLRHWLAGIARNEQPVFSLTRRVLGWIRSDAEKALVGRARLALGEGDPAAAGRALRQLRWRRDNHVVGALADGEWRRRSGHPDQAIEAARALVARRPQWTAPPLLEARAWIDAGAFFQAGELLPRLIPLARDHDVALGEASHLFMAFKNLAHPGRETPAEDLENHGAELRSLFDQILRLLNYPLR